MKNRFGSSKLSKPLGYWKQKSVQDMLDRVIDKKMKFEDGMRELDVSYDALMWRLWERRRDRGDVLTLMSESDAKEVL